MKAAIDLLLVFVNYTENSEAGNQSALVGGESPSRMDSPDALPCALLFKDAVEEVADSTGECGVHVCVCEECMWKM